MIERKMELNNEMVTSFEFAKHINWYRSNEAQENGLSMRSLRHSCLVELIEDELDDEIFDQEVIEKPKIIRGEMSKYFEIPLRLTTRLLIKESKYVRKMVLRDIEKRIGKIEVSTKENNPVQENLSTGQLILRNYLGQDISFKFENGEVYANATLMGKAFGKLTKDWLKSKQTKEYIETLERKENRPNGLVQVIQGGIPVIQGTWIHEKLILDYARWLSVDFRIWCDNQITDLLRNGKTEIKQEDIQSDTPKPKDLVEKDDIGLFGMLMTRNKAELAEATVKLTNEVHKRGRIIKENAPKVEYHDRVLNSKSTFTVTRIAKHYGMSAMKLNSILHELKIQFKQSGQWHLYSKYQDKGYTLTETNLVGTTEIRTVLQTVWTEKGKRFIFNKLKKAGVIGSDTKYIEM